MCMAITLTHEKDRVTAVNMYLVLRWHLWPGTPKSDQPRSCAAPCLRSKPVSAKYLLLSFSKESNDATLQRSKAGLL